MAQTTAPEKLPMTTLNSGEIKKGNGVKLKKELGLLNGVAIIIGIIVGSGIFVSPRGVLQESGSIGLALIVWTMCGLLSMMGALCYAELGTCIPKSGGDYAYIYEAFGPLPAFLFLWVALVIIVPGGNAISALTFANYILEPFFTSCLPPTNAVRLIATLIILHCSLHFVWTKHRKMGKNCGGKESDYLFQSVVENDENNRNVEVKRSINLFSAVTMTIGAIISSGIFVAPKAILQSTGSVGMTLVVWILSAVIAMGLALCYIELGTSIPKSGCDYAYIFEAFGSLPSFLYLWSSLVIRSPLSKTITSLVFANYILEPIYTPCLPPPSVIRLISAVIICLLTFINCYNVKWATRVQDVFTMAKILALIVIIIAGLAHMAMGNTKNFENAFEGTTTEPGYIALSFYSGLFSYAGWNFLNFVTEELKDPFQNLPRAIYISLPTVTIIYVLANVAYFAVLTPDEVLSSNAVAVTFGERILGVMSWIMPVSVALSTFGGLNGNIFASARLFFVGAREGHLPNCLAMININHFTPAPSLVFLCILSLAYLSTTEVYVLINYTAFTEALFVAFSISGMLWLRYKQPNLKRPIKVNILLPISFLVVCLFLVTLPFYVSPWETGMGIAITLSGVPVYLVTIYWTNKPLFYSNAIGRFTAFVQKLLLSVPEEKYD